MKPTKMRNRQIYKAPQHYRSSQLGSPLSAELRKKYGRRSVRVARGDTVSVVRGEYDNVSGKVASVSVRDGRIAIEGIKKEKAKGDKFDVMVHASNVVVTGLNTGDRWRADRLEGRGARKGGRAGGGAPAAGKGAEEGAPGGGAGAPDEDGGAGAQGPAAGAAEEAGRPEAREGPAGAAGEGGGAGAAGESGGEGAKGAAPGGPEEGGKAEAPEAGGKAEASGAPGGGGSEGEVGGKR